MGSVKEPEGLVGGDSVQSQCSCWEELQESVGKASGLFGRCQLISSFKPQL